MTAAWCGGAACACGVHAGVLQQTHADELRSDLWPVDITACGRRPSTGSLVDRATGSLLDRATGWLDRRPARCTAAAAAATSGGVSTPSSTAVSMGDTPRSAPCRYVVWVGCGSESAVCRPRRSLPHCSGGERGVPSPLVVASACCATPTARPPVPESPESRVRVGASSACQSEFDTSLSADGSHHRSCRHAAVPRTPESTTGCRDIRAGGLGMWGSTVSTVLAGGL